MDVFDLQAVLRLDTKDYEQGLSDSKSKLSGLGEHISSFTSKATAIAGTMAKVTTVAVGAAATGVSALTKQAVGAYSNYEQLVGGVQKLYGNMGKSLEDYAKDNGQTVEQAKGQWQALENAQNTVMQNASNAWKTAGMSANEYMETATSFSASLINSLGGDVEKAASQTDVAMRAMSDNVNTFGSNMEDVSNAFKGFSKQNYTMLDNLKLGYGGTKEEMERLIKDANEWGKANGEASNLSIDSFSDVVTAIQQVQEKQNVAGTTAREAMTTIEGSANATKAAWQNVIAAIAGGGDMKDAINSLTTAIFGDKEGEGLLSQVIPRIQTAMEGIGQFVGTAGPMISDHLPALVESIVPSLLQSTTTLIESLINALPNLVQSILPPLVEAIVILLASIATTLPSLMSGLWGAVVSSIQTLITTVQTQASAFIQLGQQIIDSLIISIQTGLPQFLQNGLSIAINLANGIMNAMPNIISTMGKILSAFIGAIGPFLPKFLSAGVQMIVQIVTGLTNSLPKIIAFVGNMITQFVGYILSHLPQIMDSAVQIIGTLAKGLINNLPQIISAIVQVIAKLIATIVQHLPEILQKGIEIIAKLAAGIIQAIPKVVASIPKVITGIKNAFTQFNWGSLGKNIIGGIANGISNAVGIVARAAKNAAKSAFEAAKNFLGIASPSKLMRDQVGKYISEGIAVGIEDNLNSITNSMNDVADLVSQPITPSVGEISAENASDGYTAGNMITINVYGAQGQSVETLADLVADKINNAVTAKRRVFG